MERKRDSKVKGETALLEYAARTGLRTGLTTASMSCRVRRVSSMPWGQHLSRSWAILGEGGGGDILFS